MKLVAQVQQHLGWKLLLSYVLVLVIGVVVLDTVTELQPTVRLTQNIPELQSVIAGDPGVLAALEANFQATVHQHLILATLAGLIAAFTASVFTTRRIIGPIREMMKASRRVASGDYHVRIDPPARDELGELAQSLNQMAEALDRTEHRRIELIGDVAHELRTPLSSLSGSLEGLVDGVIPDKPETFVELQRETSRMQRLVSDLEELSRAEAGQIRIEARPVALEESMRIVAERLRPQFDDKGVALELEIPSNLPRAQADANRITQVLMNLIGNGLQYTPAGGSVTVRARHERGEIIVSIEDSGIGIAGEQLPHIFERFFRVDKSRARTGGGSGIGLTIARHLVEAQGGEIRADSPGLGKGSTFTFTLPLSS